MSTPNTPTPKTDDSEHIDPSDLLGPDGTVDTSKVKCLTNRRDGVAGHVDSDECATIRERLASEHVTATTVAAEMGYGSTAVRNHATGECACRHTTPTVTYDPSTGWAADE